MFASFTGQNTGTFDATIIPEPTSLSMACRGLSSYRWRSATLGAAAPEEVGV
jgi:hypothetical protein